MEYFNINVFHNGTSLPFPKITNGLTQATQTYMRSAVVVIHTTWFRFLH